MNLLEDITTTLRYRVCVHSVCMLWFEYNLGKYAKGFVRSHVIDICSYIR